MDKAHRATTPDGLTGTVLHWPTSQYFRILRNNGADVEHVAVTPILLDSGEVRFFSQDAVTTADGSKSAGQ